MYKGNVKHVLRDVGVILAKVNQALQTLEKYKSVLQQVLTNLTALEFEGAATLADVTMAVQRAQMVERVANEIERYIIELGTEGRLVSMQLEELMVDIEDEGYLVIRDYLTSDREETAEQVWQSLSSWESEDLLDQALTARALGYGSNMNNPDYPVVPRGYRVVSRIPRLPMPVIENLVNTFKELPNILQASIDELDDVEGIGEVRAKAIREGLRRMREQVLLDRHI